MVCLRDSFPILVAARRWLRAGPVLVSIMATVALAAPPPAVQAHPVAAIQVTTTADEWNEGADCSLREAIQAANTDKAFGGCPAGSGSDVIDLPAGTYALTRVGGHDDSNATGDLDLNSDITINGAGQATTVIDGDERDRVLHVLGHTVEVNQLAVTGGHPPDGAPGADGVSQGADGEAGGSGSPGGGIYNLGTLTLNLCLVSGNQAGNGGSGGDGQAGSGGSSSNPGGNQGGDGALGGSGGRGGGIYSEGPLTLNSCTVESNQGGQAGSGGDGGDGGDAYSPATISGVGGAGGNGGDGGNGGSGGGIAGRGSLTLNDTIVRDNQAGDGAPSGQGGAGGDGGAGMVGLTGATGGAGGAGGYGGEAGRGGFGGGIYHVGLLSLTRCQVSGNQAGAGGQGRAGGAGGLGGSGGDGIGGTGMGGAGGAGGDGSLGGISGWGGGGGGIWSSGSLELPGGLQMALSEVSLNTAGDGAPGGSGGAGGNGGDGGIGSTIPGSGGDGGSGGNGGSGTWAGLGGRGGGVGADGFFGQPVALTDSSITGNVSGSGANGGNGGPGGVRGSGGYPGGTRGVNGDGGSGGAGTGSQGGGLNLRTVGPPNVIDGCTISHNVVGDGGHGGDGGDGGAEPGDATGSGGDGGDGGSGGEGGGLRLETIVVDSSIYYLVNVTVSGNRVGSGGDGGNGGSGPAGDGEAGGGGDAGSGGGIYSSPIYAFAYNCTVGGNKAIGSGGLAGTGSTTADPGDPGVGGGIRATGTSSDLHLAHTLLGDNTAKGEGPDCHGNVDSDDYNLIESIAGCTLSGDTTHNIVGEDPALGPLADNGGSTETHALLESSPALDGGSPICYDPEGSILAVDQRDKTRPVDGDENGSLLCDIGAVEMQGDFSLMVTLDGDGSGCVTSQPAGIDCGSPGGTGGTDCSQDYFEGTVVTLTAAAETGSHLVGWAGACSGTNPVCPVTVLADKTATATFGLNLTRVYLPIVLRD